MHANKLYTQINHFHHPPKMPRKAACTNRQCNLCNEKFLAISKFERFCLNCKKDNELYHYHETLPTISEALI